MPIRCSNSRTFFSMKRRACCSWRLRVSSFPQYGQRLHPSGNVFLHAAQRMLFGSGIVNGAHCTLPVVDEARRRTLQALLHLVGGDTPSACWDDRRAAALLQKQATPDELRELGADEKLVEWIFSEVRSE